ncbi:FMRFamide receptor-like isoform X1 [Palaemon carinicauda]|uniref:FMRFamide receptor-like isoform X1 n=1 Tax=Palaemon carinicauda TaxID=392227 RepID=UPI0035B65B2B
MALESVTANATEALPEANGSFITGSNGTFYEYDHDEYDEFSAVPSPLFRFVVQGLLLTLIGLFGLAGNIISIVILYRLNMRSSINCCLLGLTTFDLLVIITSALSFGLLEIGLYTNSISWYVNGLLEAMPTVFPLGIIARTGSIYLTLILTVERYVAVCLPFRFRSLVTYGRARILVMAAAVFSVLYNLPRFWEHYYEEHQRDGKKFFLIKPTALRQNYVYQQVYITWIYLIVQYLIPFLSLLILNSQIYLEVRAANQNIERLSRPQRKEIKLALMLLAVVTVFFLCNILPCVLNILEIASIAIHKLREISNLLVTINSSVNFVIYCTFSQRFRKDFLELFRYCCGRQGLELVSGSSPVSYEAARNGRPTEIVMVSVRSEPRLARLLDQNDADDNTL